MSLKCDAPLPDIFTPRRVGIQSRDDFRLLLMDIEFPVELSAVAR